ncbi:branched-chain-amino-acid aminotransferase [Ruminiclostridium hungatei]|uniref:Branched-chain-amino-acid aminotransferase n=1 Tax=Ruminiclostridium hungatei TaxID=48256 RepID=A0A1V4SMQ7_RUMHU|nr:aminotransferase class IV [Ruminiclostridium hungatei]OPX45150.1 branched-chain-amino-acid aminotransferase [Ruminiclostridium hungatei]
MEKLNIAFFNNQIISAADAVIPILDQSVQYGWGLFETIKVNKGIPIMLEEHLRRIFASASRLKIENSISKADLTGNVYKFLEAMNSNTFVLKVAITKGVNHTPNIFFTCREIGYSEKDYVKGFSAKTTDIRRNESSPLVYMKTLNYMENIMAKQEARERGYDEAIFLNSKGFLSEGSVSNLFFIRDLKIYTPKLQCGLLPGIVRDCLVKNIIPRMGMELCEGEYEPSHLFDAEEAFLTNSIMEIMPLVKIDEVVIGKGSKGKITDMLSKEYEKFVYGQG